MRAVENKQNEENNSSISLEKNRVEVEKCFMHSGFERYLRKFSQKNPFRRWKILIYRVTSSFVFNLLRKAERNSDEGTFCRRARCTQSIILISRAARKARTAKRWKLLSYFPKITQKISARFEISEGKIIRGMTRQIGVSGMETTSGGDETLKVGGA